MSQGFTMWCDNQFRGVTGSVLPGDAFQVSGWEQFQGVHLPPGGVNSVDGTISGNGYLKVSFALGNAGPKTIDEADFVFLIAYGGFPVSEGMFDTGNLVMYPFKDFASHWKYMVLTRYPPVPIWNPATHPPVTRNCMRFQLNDPVNNQVRFTIPAGQDLDVGVGKGPFPNDIYWGG